MNTQERATVQLQAREELKRREALRTVLEAENPEIYALVQATNKADPAPSDIERLQTYLTENRQAVEKLGNLAEMVKTSVVNGAFTSAMTIQAVTMHLANMRADMGYNTATAIEKGLIDHICLCWLRLHIAEFHYEQYTKNASLDRAMFWEKALSQNQKRYLRSIETLAKVRKLQQPAPNPLTLALVNQQF